MTSSTEPAADPVAAPGRPRRRLRGLLSPLRWVQVGFVAIAVVAVLVGVGYILPAVPNDGPSYELPESFTATTDDGRAITFTAVRGVRYGLLRQDTSMGYRADIREVSTPHPSSTEFPFVNESLGEDTVGRNSITVSYTRIAQGRSQDGPNPTVTDAFGDPELTYLASESLFPGLTHRELGDLEDGAMTLTSDLDTIMDISYAYGRDGNTDEGSEWRVTFNFNALQQAGKTNLIYPLDWYANPLFPELRRVAPWVAGVAILAALLTPLPFGIARRRRERREREESRATW